MNAIIAFSVCLVLCFHVTNADLKIDARFSSAITTKEFQENEDVELECLLERPGGFDWDWRFAWYKKQGSDPQKVASDRVCVDPFNDEYKYESILNHKHQGDSNKMQYLLTIKGVEAVDAGDYMCSAGLKGSDPVSSNLATLIYMPKGASSTILLSTPAAKDGNKHNFNNTNLVECSSTVTSNSPNLNLVMRLGTTDSRKVSQDFTPETAIRYEGNTIGLQEPKTTVTLKNEAWQPMEYGENVLKCILADGDNDLAHDEMDIVRDAPPKEPKLKCRHTPNKPLSDDTLDVAIICRVMDGQESGEYSLNYTFIHNRNPVSLLTGNDDYERMASKDSNEFVLKIPRITTEMVVGGGSTYNITLLHKENNAEKVVLVHTFRLPITDAKGVRGGATAQLGSILVIVSALIAAKF